MGRPDDLFGLEDFARRYLAPIDHHEEVRTEHLAEAFRQAFGLSPFPSLRELARLCQRLGIDVERLPPSSGTLEGLNVWPDGATPAIYLRPDLDLRRAETTLGHELREVIENAFRRVKPSYAALDTRDNATMNRESDHFAGCLLMAAEPTRARLRELGFDLVRFAVEHSRSLPSVLLRAQELFPARSGHPGPVAAFWLFEAPWPTVQQGAATPDDLAVRYVAKLCGFSTRQARPGLPGPAATTFPSRATPVSRSVLARRALARRAPAAARVRGLDLFGERDAFCVAEPFFARGVPWRVLLTAVHTPSLPLVQPWLQRFRFEARDELFQQA